MMKGVNMPAIEKKPATLKGFRAGNVSSDIKSHSNDPFVIKKVEEATETLKGVGLPGEKKK